MRLSRWPVPTRGTESRWILRKRLRYGRDDSSGFPVAVVWIPLHVPVRFCDESIPGVCDKLRDS